MFCAVWRLLIASRCRQVKHKEVMIKGDPRDGVVDACEEIGASLLVVGCHNKGAIARCVPFINCCAFGPPALRARASEDLTPRSQVGHGERLDLLGAARTLPRAGRANMSVAVVVLTPLSLATHCTLAICTRHANKSGECNRITSPSDKILNTK